MELYSGIIFMKRIHGMPGTSPEPPGFPGHAPGTHEDAPGPPGHAPGTPGDAWDPRARPWDPRGTSLRPPKDAPGTPGVLR